MLKVVTNVNDALVKKRRMAEMFEDEEIVTLINNFESRQTRKVVTNTKGKLVLLGFNQQLTNCLKNPIKEEADDHVADFFYSSVIPFNYIKNSLCKNM